MMSRLPLCLLFSFMLTSCATQSVDEPTRTELNRKEIKKLIEELPSVSQLHRHRDVLMGRASHWSLGFAKENIEEAKSIVPQLRKSIQKGKSIFEYPGLIAKGGIEYRAWSDEYSIYIGVYLRDLESTGPYDFKIITDNNGIIKDVHTVKWKD